MGMGSYNFHETCIRFDRIYFDPNPEQPAPKGGWRKLKPIGRLADMTTHHPIARTPRKAR